MHIAPEWNVSRVRHQILQSGKGRLRDGQLKKMTVEGPVSKIWSMSFIGKVWQLFRDML
jgi:hypothetical protein